MTRVRCANCGYVYEREAPKDCPRCGSNAADSIEVRRPGEKHEENGKPTPRVLTDDLRWE